MSDLINRQDAIYALTEANLKSHMDSVEGGQENRSAIRIIMKLPSADASLMQDRCKIDTSSDLISRQDAIELIHSLYPSAPVIPWNRKQWEKKYKPYIETEKVLEMLPSAERKRGEWIDQVGEDELPTQKCSVCGYLEYVYGRPNYCPNCGARMDEGDDNDDN